MTKAQQPNPKSDKQAGGHPAGVAAADFQQLLHARARLDLIIDHHQARGQYPPVEVQQAAEAIDREATAYLSEAERAEAWDHVQRIKQTLFEQSRHETRESLAAERLRARDAATRKATEGMFGEKDGLPLEEYERLTTPGDNHRLPMTTKIPTGRAYVDENHMQSWATQINTKLGLKRDAPWKKTVEVLDSLEESRTRDPDKFRELLIDKGIDPAFISDTLKDWGTHSVALGLAEKLSKQDDEKRIPFEETHTISPDNRRRLDVIKHSTDHLAEASQTNPEHADYFAGDVSQRTREDAVRETFNLRNSDPSIPDALSMKDALIRAYDAHENPEPEPNDITQTG